MCQQCVKRSKNLGRGQVKLGLIKVLAIQLLKYHRVPFFWDNRDNYAVEAQAYKILQSHTNAKIYKRATIAQRQRQDT